MARFEEPKYLRWSEGAIRCYAIGCNCNKCDIYPEDIKKKCRMKQSVMILVRDIGKPFERENVLTNNTL